MTADTGVEIEDGVVAGTGVEVGSVEGVQLTIPETDTKTTTITGSKLFIRHSY